MNHLRCVLSIVLMLIAVTVQAEETTRIFELENRPAHDLVSHLSKLYPDPRTAFSADGQRLIVNGPSAVVDEITGLIARLDVAPVQLRVSVRRQRGGESQNATRISTISGQDTQSVVVQSGETARIESGSIRRVTRAVAGGDTVALIAEDTPMTSGFLVQPRALGPNQVELRVVSFNNDPPPHRAAGSDRATAALVTMRRAAPGEWVTLGGRRSSASTQTTDTYTTRHLSEENQSWSVKVDILR